VALGVHPTQRRPVAPMLGPWIMDKPNAECGGRFDARRSSSSRSASCCRSSRPHPADPGVKPPPPGSTSSRVRSWSPSRHVAFALRGARGVGADRTRSRSTSGIAGGAAMDDHRSCARRARRSSCSRTAPALARRERCRGDSNASRANPGRIGLPCAEARHLFGHWTDARIHNPVRHRDLAGRRVHPLAGCKPPGGLGGCEERSVGLTRRSTGSVLTSEEIAAPAQMRGGTPPRLVALA
jgi:hypothetical protein